jgi:7-carboxy-7-deazaguanine synthase
MSKKYKLTEIFYSIQGEGYWSGKPSIFVRFSSCNLKCVWCDTDFRYRYSATAQQILQQIIDENPVCKQIVFTGGEPSFQVDNELCQLLKDNGYYLTIESNGTHPVCELVDWVTISPKHNSIGGDLAPWTIKKGSELKLVHEPGANIDLKQIEDETDFEFYFLQPESMKNNHEIAQIVMQNPRWQVSLQTHKYLGLQ